MRKGSLWIIIGLLLIAAALGLTLYNVFDSQRAGRASDKALSALASQIKTVSADSVDRPQNVTAAETVPGETGAFPAAEPVEIPDYVLVPDKKMPEELIDGDFYIGILSIPAIDRELPIISSWNYTKLKTAPCRYTGSAYLDNMTICAHNFSRHFGQIGTLALGDTVIFTDVDGNVFTYQVAEIETLQPTAIDQMTESPWDLTLFTCTLGGRTRVTVRCSRVSP